MKLENKTYDLLKDIAQIWLPALATLIVTICMIWELPYGESIGATIMAIDVFMGAILKVSANQYNKDNKEKEEA